jgi:PIN domain nuclease of toxin-antitoxin system
MNILLDTHIVLWSVFKTRSLSSDARAILEDPANQLIFSVVNLWEITIKRGQGRRDFQVDPRPMREALLLSGYRELPITSEHAMAVGQLPRIHKDPFDRLLVAQANVEGCLLLTADSKVSRYPGLIRQV